MKATLLILACVVTALFTSQTKGQSITPYNLCQDLSVNVVPNTNGIIQHTKRNTADNCTLTITGLTSYVTLLGISGEPVSQCTTTTVYVNNLEYCVDSNSFPLTFLSASSFNISVAANSPSFSVKYYNNVFSCGENVAVPDNAESNKISGIILGRKSAMFNSLADCTTRILNLPSRSVVFNIHLDSVDGLPNNDVFIINSRQLDVNGSMVVLESAADNVSMNVVYQSGTSEARFYIIYSVAMCGELPPLANAQSPRTVLPWYPGSKITYRCSQEYRLKSGQSMAECKVVGTKAIWNGLADIKCIPEAKCYKFPPTLPNADGSKRQSVWIVDYTCHKGYQATGSKTTSACLSKDPENIPWEWELASPGCTKVKCEVKDGFLDTSTGRITSSGDKDGSYFYQDYFEYRCYPPQFTKASGHNFIQCESDGNWTTTPLCIEQRPSCELPVLVANCDQTEGASNLTVVYSCKTGYGKISGDSIITCGWKNRKSQWIGDLPVCEPHIKDGVQRGKFIGVAVGLSLGCVAFAIALIVVVIKSRRNVGNSVGKTRGDSLPMAVSNPVAAVQSTAPGEDYKQPIMTKRGRVTERTHSIPNTYVNPRSEQATGGRNQTRATAIPVYDEVPPHVSTGNKGGEEIYVNVSH